jgi:carbon monoxide dehydrogenase subunit G
MPSTVQASEEIIVESDLMKCFSFFTNLENIGACIPGCEKVTLIDSNSANFRVKVKVGYISRIFELKARITDVRPNEGLSFLAEGSDAEITGTVDLDDKDRGATGVKYSIEIRATSVTGKTALSMIGKDLVKKQATDFASCVKTRLEH